MTACEIPSKDRFAKLIASLFFVGYIPFAPGTWASLLTAIVIYSLVPSQYELLLAIPIIFALGLWSSRTAERCWGKDNKRIVIDECLGQTMAFLSVPVTAVNIGLGFVLFRFFDIFKPFPIRQLETRLKGAMAVMVDDLAAGIASNIVLQAVLLTKGLLD